MRGVPRFITEPVCVCVYKSNYRCFPIRQSEDSRRLCDRGLIWDCMEDRCVPFPSSKQGQSSIQVTSIYILVIFGIYYIMTQKKKKKILIKVHSSFAFVRLTLSLELHICIYFLIKVQQCYKAFYKIRYFLVVTISDCFLKQTWEVH